MPHFEYKVIPAPARPRKLRGAGGPEARFALSLAAELNEQAGEGWEYLRADTLPVEERRGLTGRRTRFQTVLVFRRLVDVDEADATREALRLLARGMGEG